MYRQRRVPTSRVAPSATAPAENSSRSRDGVLHKAVYYKADFVYREQSGEEVVEDVKALDNATGKYLTTETFRLKWKLLMANYPDKVFRLF